MIPDARRVIPPADPQTPWFDAAGRVAARPRALAPPGAGLDPAAIVAVLQIGAIPPPLSPWCGVRRFRPASQYVGTRRLGPTPLPTPPGLATLDAAGRATLVADTLDRVLRETLGDRPDPIVLFSGGVDSGLLAARLVALGRRDTWLCHYSFGPNDPETALAAAMARHLGLHFRVVSGHRPLAACLDDPGRVYPVPFLDQSVVPTSDLAHGVLAAVDGQHRPILDGTGADGAFGMAAYVRRWQMVRRLPRHAHTLGAWAYRAALWRRPGRLEWAAGLLGRAATMPALAGALALTHHVALVYEAAPTGRVHAAIEACVDGWGGNTLAQQVVAADLAVTGAQRLAQKADPIFARAGRSVVYPFLHPALIALALGAVERWPAIPPKAVLREALARHVPRTMIDRPKSGFDDPHHRVWHDRTVLACLRAALEPTSPLAGVVRPRAARRALDAVARGVPLPRDTYRVLWGLTFLDRWSRTAA